MTLDEIKRTVKMVDVLARYGIKPNRAGFIRCPFHSEKTASMKIWHDSFRCFGCNAHGDVVDFVAKMDGVTFSEAFTSLGGTTGKKPTDIHAHIAHRMAIKRERERKARITAYDQKTAQILAIYDGVCKTLQSLREYLQPWRDGCRPPTEDELIALLMEQKHDAWAEELLDRINERRAKRVGI